MRPLKIPTAAASLLLVGLAGGTIRLEAADLARATELLHQNKYAEAQQTLQQIVAAEPNDAATRTKLGYALLGQHKGAEARAEFERAIALDGNSDDAQAGLAGACIEQQKFDDAKAALDRAQSLLDASNEGKETKRGNENIEYYRGLLALRDRNLQEAVTRLENTLRLDPKNAYAHYYLGQAYGNLKRSDKMVDHLQTFLKLAPDAPEAKKVQALLRSVR